MSKRSSILGRRKGQRMERCIKRDEAVVFFPTAAWREGGCWQVPIHGWIHRPIEVSRLRRMALRLVKRVVKVRYPEADLSTPLFRQRAGAFLSDNDRDCCVQIRLGEVGTCITLKKSRPNGHFEDVVEVPGVAGAKWMTYRAVVEEEDARVFEGRTLLVPEEGISVISDIDDTIKVTEVLDRRRMLRNTFLRDFVHVAGMAELYQRWAARREAAFHYVSASPWHLYPFLGEFLGAQKFPEGTFHLRDFRLMPRNVAQTLRPSRRVKVKHIRELMARFPRRRFVLVGDSGESDGSIYAKLAREFPQQVEKIYIRNVTGETGESRRWKRVFGGLKKERWQVFTEATEITE